MQDVIVGFIDPNEEIADPNAKSDDDDEESDEAPDTGPDPAEVASRLKKIRKLQKKYVEILAKHGLAHAATQKALRGLVAEFMEIKLAPNVITSYSIHYTKLYDALGSSNLGNSAPIDRHELLTANEAGLLGR